MLKSRCVKLKSVSVEIVLKQNLLFNLNYLFN